MARAKKAATGTRKGPKTSTKEKAPRGKTAAAAPDATAIKMISPKKLLSLLGSARAAYKEGRSIAGELGALIKDAAEHDHLHKKAFASVKSADRMEPEALADFFAHRDFYEESLGLRKRAGSVVRMDFSDDGRSEGGDNTDPQPETADSKARTGNVRPFPGPTGQAAE